MDKQTEDAYQRGLKLSIGDLSMALVMCDMRLDGTWPKGRPAVTGKDRKELLARQVGLKRAFNERRGEH
jgi:hypothetical protein